MVKTISEKEIYLHFENFFVNKESIRQKVKKWIPQKCHLLLDLGCKNGVITSSYLGYSQKVVGVDKAYNHLLKAGEKYSKIKFINGDASFLPFKDSCAEVIVLVEILQYITEIEKIFSEAYRVLKPGGILIISLPQKRGFSKYLNFFNYDKIKTIFKKEDKALREESTFYLHSFKEVENLSKGLFNIKEHERKGFLLYPISYTLLMVLVNLTSLLLPDTKKQEKNLIIFSYSILLFSFFRLLFWFFGFLMVIDSNLNFWKFSYSLLISMQKELPDKGRIRG